MHVRFEGVPAPGDGMSVLRVVIAEDHYLVPEGVRRVLEEEPTSRSWLLSEPRLRWRQRLRTWFATSSWPTSACPRATRWTASARHCASAGDSLPSA
jgi:hypothetical protein